MPYRGTLEAIHARCEELAARVRELEGGAPRPRRGLNLDEALELESRLHARLVLLETCKLHEIDLTPESHPAVPMAIPDFAPVKAPPDWRRRDTFVVCAIAALLVLVTAAIAALSFARANHPKEGMLVAACESKLS